MKRKSFLLFFCLMIFSSLFLVKAQSSTVNLTVATDKQAYCGFSAVTVTGLLEDNGVPSSDGLLGLQVQDSYGNVLVTRVLKTGASTPSSQQVQISSAYLSDASGQPQSDIEADALGYFTINLLNAANTQLSMVVSLNLYDSCGIPIGQISEPCSLIAGQNASATLTVQIPNWARNGTAVGYADVYSDLPSDGGVPMACEQPFSFLILGGLNSVADVLSTSGSEGTYSTTFRLSTMGPVNDNYTVYVTSFYDGVKVSKNISFNCQFGDYNHDGIVGNQDLFIFIESYMAYSSNNANYNSVCDMNQDGKINYQDFFLFVNCYVTYWSDQI